MVLGSYHPNPIFPAGHGFYKSILVPFSLALSQWSFSASTMVSMVVVSFGPSAGFSYIFSCGFSLVALSGG